MSPTELALYEKIQAFPLDAIDADYPLSRRLARENRWTLAYATRAIEEYKKLMLLAVVAGHRVTPSEHIDQVWHLHLIYTRSYWDEFCGEILGRPLHHGPTQGGFQETSKYRDLYGQTLASYERIFGYAAPLDIWSPSDRRFGVETKVERVNVQQNWVIPKPSLPKVFKALPSLGPTKRLTIPTFDKVFRLQGVGVAIGLAITMSGCIKVKVGRPMDFLILLIVIIGFLSYGLLICSSSTMRTSTRNPRSSSNGYSGDDDGGCSSGGCSDGGCGGCGGD